MADGEAITIYHNPRCGKSRAALAILEEKGIAPTIVEYLATPPSKEELRAIVKKLGIEPEQLARKSEEIYKKKFSGKTLSGDQWLDAMAKNPILIERPIVVRGRRALIGRPPEKVLDIL
jgi:arsenate reductase